MYQTNMYEGMLAETVVLDTAKRLFGNALYERIRSVFLGQESV